MTLENIKTVYRSTGVKGVIFLILQLTRMKIFWTSDMKPKYEVNPIAKFIGRTIGKIQDNM